MEIVKNKNNVFPDIYESSGKSEDQPKITKVYRKSSKYGSNKDLSP